MKLKFATIIVAATVLCACATSKAVDEKTGRAANAKADNKTGFYYDDMARYLAGFVLPGNSNLNQYTAAPQYAEHRQKMARFWDRVRTQNINPVTEWRESTLNRNPNGVVCRDDRPAD